MKMRISLLQMIIFPVIIITVSIGIASSLLVSHYLLKTIENELQEKAVIVTQVLADHITHNVINNELAPARLVLQEIVDRTENVLYAYVTHFDGNVFTHSFSDEIPENILAHAKISANTLAAPPYLSRFTIDGHPVFQVGYPLKQGKKATIFVGIDESRITRKINTIRAFIIALTMIVVLFGIVVETFLIRHIVAPIKKLMTYMKDFGKGESKNELILKTRVKELAELSTVFNKMSTERKQIEHDLRESEQHLNILLDCIHVGVVVIKRNTHLIEYINTFATRLIGSDKNSIIGQPCHRFFCPSERCPITDLHQSVDSSERLLLKADGQAIPILKSVVQNTMRGEHFLIETFVDITNLKNAEQEARLQQERLIQADKLCSLGTLVAGVAHEINNPNNLIILNTPIIQKTWESILPIIQEYYEKNGDFKIGGTTYTKVKDNIPVLLTNIYDGAQRINELVKNLRNFARQEPSDMKDFFDINTAIQNAVAILENQIKHSTHFFRFNPARDLPVITGNSQRITQVMMNLLQNACQALRTKNEHIVISSLFNKRDNTIIVEVKDEGIGIKQEDLPHILDPFFTTKRDLGGTGLGLSISSNIINEHKGRMYFQSTLGKGTTVTIHFPVTGCEETEKGKGTNERT
ncbi:PAS domain-containing protein [bacterium]|nr:PAS domain-containing protein [bacterium]